MKAENKIKELLGIPEEYRLYSLSKEERKNGKVYYSVVAYKSKEGLKRYRVKKEIEKQILELWSEFEKEKEKKRMLKEKLIELIEKLDEEKLQEILDILEKIKD